MATNEVLAKLTELAYSEEGTILGWERLNIRPEDNPTGYDGAAFYNSYTNEVVIVNRGTEPTAGDGDWTANFQMLAGGVPDQYEYARDFLEGVRERHGDATITLTGHSLGGSLTQLLAAETRLNAVTFDAYGTAGLVADLNSRYGLDIDVNDSFDHITNHRTQFDPVSSLPNTAHLGDMHVHAAPSEIVAAVATLAASRIPSLAAASMTALGLWSHHINRFSTEIFPLPGNGVGDILANAFLDFVLTIADFLNGASDSLITRLQNLFASAEAQVSPIILDLDGNGVTTVSKSAGIHFDHDGNGFAELTGWVGSGDGLLVWDRNGNGVIDSGVELFGNHTLLNNGQKAANGFAALAGHDTNGNGVFDAYDVLWPELRVWRDLNQDGVSQADELLTLDELGIASIHLGYTNSTHTDAQGNAHKQVGSFTWADGSTGAATDVWFAADYARTKEVDLIEVPEDIAALPDLAGFGNVHSLHQAMARDASGQLQAQMGDCDGMYDVEWKVAA